ncbi:MAG: helix-turn-helix domain-containing protein [Rhodobacter sp.]|nr:helix-turn-helix domain-containing protein [Paracoccaceae bacterium]MCC0075467.1 helix-turn-helix domain-containing protein [Rhodobacter sp.]
MEPSEGSVRALTRGLDVLRVISISGGARIAEIAQLAALTRPTVYRLVQTLQAAGYVSVSAGTGIVRVTRLAATLSAGATDEAALAQAAVPLFAHYAARLVWPLDVSVRDGDSMVILETTHAQSPLSVDRGMAGSRLPILRSSAGRCYLAHCPAAERVEILAALRDSAVPDDAPFLTDSYLEAMHRRVAECDGLAVRDAGEFRPMTASFALPVRRGGALIGCVSMIWIRSALSLAQARMLAEAPLRGLVQELEAALDL